MGAGWVRNTKKNAKKVKSGEVRSSLSILALHVPRVKEGKIFVKKVCSK